MRIAHADGRATVLHLCGALDHRSYEAFIAAAAELYQSGWRSLTLDLSGMSTIELSGLFALHSVARLYRGEALLNAEAGWAELRAAADDQPITPQTDLPFQLLAPQPAVAARICHAGCGRFPVSDDPALATD